MKMSMFLAPYNCDVTKADARKHIELLFLKFKKKLIVQNIQFWVHLGLPVDRFTTFYGT